MVGKPTLDDVDFDAEELSGPRIDRRTTMKLLGLAGASSLAGCTGGGGGSTDSPTEASGGDGDSDGDSDDDTDASPSSDRAGGRLSAGWGLQETGRLLPHFTGSTSISNLGQNMFTSLVRLNQNFEYEGYLAKDWTVENDGQRYVFNLREGVQFHGDYGEVTAEDVVWTLQYIRDMEYRKWPANFAGVIRPLDDNGAIAVDDYTLELNFRQPFATILTALRKGEGTGVLCKEAVDEMGDEAYATKPIGSGPFMITEHVVDSSVTMDANPDFFLEDEDGNQLPYVDGVDFFLTPEAQSNLNALKAGDIDYLQSPNESLVAQIESDNNLHLGEIAGLNWQGIGFNQKRDPLGERDFRLAIAKAIDREQFIEDTWNGTAVPGIGPIPPSQGFWYNEDKSTTQETDQEEAHRILEENGWKGTTFECMIWPGSGRWPRMLRRHLEPFDITVEPNVVPSTTFSEKKQNDNFDSYFPGFYGFADPDTLNVLYHSEGDWNHWNHWESDRFDELWEEQRRTLDREERRDKIWEAENILIDEVASVYLVHQNDIMAWNDGMVRGFEDGWFPNQRRLENVWLDE
jgi:peptide/nickel transport system substrate-binding protein